MIIDFNTHFGSGPGMIDNCTPEELFKQVEAAGIDCAVTSNLRTAFGDKSVDESIPDGLIRFASISPDSDLSSLDSSIKGIRIYPTYQDWDFDSPKAQNLLTLARDRNLVVQIYLRLRDPRALLQTTSSADGIQALNNLAQAHPNIKFVVSGANYFEISANPVPFKRENVWSDISHVQHPTNSLIKLIGVLGSSRLLFGTNAPIFYPYANVFRVENSPLSDDDRERLLYKNAQELLGNI